MCPVPDNNRWSPTVSLVVADDHRMTSIHNLVHTNRFHPDPSVSDAAANAIHAHWETVALIQKVTK